MPSKTSSIKKQIIRHDIRLTGWLSVLYFLALFVILPLQILFQYTNPETRRYMEKGSLFLYLPELQWILSITVPVFFGVILFRYLHKKQTSDFVHSMPIKRSALLHHHAATGLILLTLPIILNGIILYVLKAFTGIGSYYNGMNVLYWLCVLLFLNVLIYTATNFIGMVTGLLSMHVVLTYIFVLFPAGIMILIFFNLRTLLTGFPLDYYLDAAVVKFSPISYFMGIILSQHRISWFMISIFAAAGILLYLGAYWLYVHRKLEYTSQAIVYPFMQPVFRFGVTFCVMMTGGLYFHEMTGSMSWTVIGYLAGSLLGFIIAEAILKKTWRVYSNYKSYLIFAGFLVAVFLSVYLVKESYENNIPEVSEVEKVYFGDEFTYNRDEDYIPPGIEPLYFTEENDIEMVQRLQKEVIESSSSQFADSSDDTRYTFIVYELKNGKKLARSYAYSLEENPKLKKLQYEIEGSSQYKHANNQVFNVDRDAIYALDLQSNLLPSDGPTISDQNTIDALLDALKKDIDSTHTQINPDKMQTYTIDFLTKKPDIYYYASFDDSYENTVKVLEDAGLYEDIRTVPEDIAYLQLDDYNYENTLKVEDQKDIKYIFDHLIEYSGKQDSYYVGIKLDGESDISAEFSIEYDDLPESIKNQLEE
ncbi:DMT family transporter [Terribacillus saccharophilus]|uniref:ABC-2 type transport system permease protein n=1 Tax=Terribacillus saccharophilus TaxID=361277 RepID=A0ABX4GV53_9BACI|nr:DMT family transporter [Terribacillus saccharophilus]PAD34417.1 hypothetical protein CHH56_13830 [Terribacillus saccharophilus]PAD95291.1 hypothetical protein CHH50_14060 [Terribacillus saccharophilus]PAD98744.1 hypothetical protein CHH48_14955 [Terribacillus saccharophilus]